MSYFSVLMHPVPVQLNILWIFEYACRYLVYFRYLYAAKECVSFSLKWFYDFML